MRATEVILVQTLFIAHCLHVSCTHQAKLIMVDAKVIEQNAAYLDCYLTVNEPGTELTSVSANATVKKQLPADTKISIHIQKLSPAGTYANIGVPIEKELCNYILHDKLFYPAIARMGNFPTACPIKPNNYYINNMRLDTSGLPPLIPAGVFRGYFLITTKEELILNGYCETILKND